MNGPTSDLADYWTEAAAACPLGECDGSGLIVTTDMTGQTEDQCRCIPSIDPEVEARLRASLLEEIAASRLVRDAIHAYHQPALPPREGEPL